MCQLTALVLFLDTGSSVQHVHSIWAHACLETFRLLLPNLSSTFTTATELKIFQNVYFVFTGMQLGNKSIDKIRRRMFRVKEEESQTSGSSWEDSMPGVSSSSGAFRSKIKPIEKYSLEWYLTPGAATFAPVGQDPVAGQSSVASTPSGLAASGAGDGHRASRPASRAGVQGASQRQVRIREGDVTIESTPKHRTFEETSSASNIFSLTGLSTKEV